MNDLFIISFQMDKFSFTHSTKESSQVELENKRENDGEEVKMMMA